MRLLVFQHVDCEHPGSLRQCLADDRIDWQAVNLHRQEPIPDLSDYDALWVMGGPMDVWDVGDFPWLEAEKAAIKSWVLDLKKPYLGLCLGHQLLADALGGSCAPMKTPEIGVLDIALTADGREDPLFADMPHRQKCLQWHSVEVAKPPESATVLATSDACRVQAMRVGAHAWSMQYHVEVEPDTVTNWAQIPAYAEALSTTLGEGALDQMRADADRNMQAFLTCAETLYRNFSRALP